MSNTNEGDVWIFTVGSGNENERAFRDDCIRHVSACSIRMLEEEFIGIGHLPIINTRHLRD